MCVGGNLYAFELVSSWKQNKGKISTKALSERLRKQQPESKVSTEGGKKINAERQKQANKQNPDRHAR